MERHEADMRRALGLAERGWGRVSPNPLVGAVATPEEVWQMVDEMVVAEARWLPAWLGGNA